MTDSQKPAAFTELVNLAARSLGAGVIAANDELFAEKENLIVAKPAEFRPHTFGHKGQIMDGWETRRRRGAGAQEPHPTDDDHDWAVGRTTGTVNVTGPRHALTRTRKSSSTISVPSAASSGSSAPSR